MTTIAIATPVFDLFFGGWTEGPDGLGSDDADIGLSHPADPSRTATLLSVTEAIISPSLPNV